MTGDWGPPLPLVPPWDDEFDEDPDRPEIEVDWDSPAVLGRLLGPKGEVLVAVVEDRPTFGFARYLDEADR